MCFLCVFLFKIIKHFCCYVEIFFYCLNVYFSSVQLRWDSFPFWKLLHIVFCILCLYPDCKNKFTTTLLRPRTRCKKNKQYLLKIGPPEYKIGKYHSSSTQPQPNNGGFKMGQLCLDLENSRKLAYVSLTRASR